MSAAASSALPTVVRSSSSHGQPAYSPSSSGQPTRTRSTTTRSTSSSHHAHRSTSRSYPHEAPPTANQAALANVAQRDFETTNIARPSSSRRSSSRDGQPEYHSDTSRSQHRASSRPVSSHTDMSRATTVVNGGSTATPKPTPAVEGDRPSATSQPSSTGKRRTSIATSTGTWLLGKTIGQGSMGKVKLAKNLETGEQVRARVITSSPLTY